MKRLLWSLWTATILFSAWGLFWENAIAADRDPQVAEPQVLRNAGWETERTMGVATRPPPDDISQYLTPVSESAGSDDSTPSYSSDESSSDD